MAIGLRPALGFGGAARLIAAARPAIGADRGTVAGRLPPAGLDSSRPVRSAASRCSRARTADRLAPALAGARHAPPGRRRRTGRGSGRTSRGRGASAPSTSTRIVAPFGFSTCVGQIDRLVLGEAVRAGAVRQEAVLAVGPQAAVQQLDPLGVAAAHEHRGCRRRRPSRAAAAAPPRASCGSDGRSRSRSSRAFEACRHQPVEQADADSRWPPCRRAAGRATSRPWPRCRDAPRACRRRTAAGTPRRPCCRPRAPRPTFLMSAMSDLMCFS